MEGGSRQERESKDGRKKGEKLGSVFGPRIEPFVPRKGYDPNELRSWAKKTGFVSTTFSGETHRSESVGRDLNEGRNAANDGYGDVERGGAFGKNDSISPKIEIDPILGRTRNRGPEIEPVRGVGNGRERRGVERDDNEVRRNAAAEASPGTDNGLRTDVHEGGTAVGDGQSNGASNAPAMEPKSGHDVNMYADGEDSGNGGWHPSPKMIFGLKDNPGYG